MTTVSLARKKSRSPARRGRLVPSSPGAGLARLTLPVPRPSRRSCHPCGGLGPCTPALRADRPLPQHLRGFLLLVPSHWITPCTRTCTHVHTWARPCLLRGVEAGTGRANALPALCALAACPVPVPGLRPYGVSRMGERPDGRPKLAALALHFHSTDGAWATCGQPRPSAGPKGPRCHNPPPPRL